jgi:hypothetical protein
VLVWLGHESENEAEETIVTFKRVDEAYNELEELMARDKTNVEDCQWRAW